MKIKNIKEVILLAMALILLSSCEKWLEVKPATQLERSDFLNTEEGYITALAGVYSKMSSTNLYGCEMTFGTMDVLAGYYYPSNSNPTTYYKLYRGYSYKHNNYPDDACVAIIDEMWNGMYNAIAMLNSLLETIDENKSIFTGNNYKVIKGEAIGLRAFLHLDILRMFGPSYAVDPSMKCIPYVDTLSSKVTPLLSVEEACNKIISELIIALELMDDDPIKTGTTSSILSSKVATTTLPAYHNRKYHFNFYAVKAALARAYLWKGDKVNALKLAKEVIEAQATRFPWVQDANLTSINSSSAANKDRLFATEHIFALNIRNLENYIPDYFSSAGSQVGLQLFCQNSRRNTIFENSTIDPRSQYLFIANGSSYSFPTKLYQDGTTSLWFKYQIPLIRVSEMYYIAAECEPGLSEGLAWLNTIRGIRKLNPIASVSSQAALQTEIQKEHQKEFMCEGQLWFYYKRHNFSTLPLNSNFGYYAGPEYYVFDLPENEILYGGRNN